ncbi:MAG: response regulator [Alphaproteobacteria bacterium]|nr:response regulator [Alphaproteobacteria bacterium]
METAAKSKSGTVLVVDDDPTSRLLASEILTNAGYTVFVAGNPDQSMQRLLFVGPSIILFDVNLGLMSGYDLCTKSKTAYPNLRSVFMFVTVNRTLDDVMTSKRVGGDDFIVKPFTAEELLTNIRKAIVAKQRRQ